MINSKEPKRVVAVDLDETLFPYNLLTRLLLWLSKALYKLAILLETVDIGILAKLERYSIRMVLSARANDWARNITLAQLQVWGIKVDRVILCPRKQLYDNWKRNTISSLREKYDSVEWIDNDIEECA